MTKFLVPNVDRQQRDLADLRFVMWCCINLRPQQMRYDDGFKLFVGVLSPQYVDTIMAAATFNNILDTLYDKVKQNVMDDMRSLREECLDMGYGGAFLGAQLDLTTVAGEEYITFTVSYVRKSSSEVSRVALATRAFPGSHTADDIKPWIEAVRLFRFFALCFIRCLYCYYVIMLLSLAAVVFVGAVRNYEITKLRNYICCWAMSFVFCILYSVLHFVSFSGILCLKL